MQTLTEKLLNLPGNMFTQSDAALLLEGTPDRRHALVKRALAKGEILGIRRGLYCLAPQYQRKPVNVFALAQRVYGPSYVSMESALGFHGWIPEAVYACTCASLGNARAFETPLGTFLYRRVPQRVFYANVDRLTDNSGNVFLMASPAKALADYVYTRKPPWRGIDDAAESLRIEPEAWHGTGAPELDELAANYASRRVTAFLRRWKEALPR